MLEDTYLKWQSALQEAGTRKVKKLEAAQLMAAILKFTAPTKKWNSRERAMEPEVQEKNQMRELLHA